MSWAVSALLRFLLRTLPVHLRYLGIGGSVPCRISGYGTRILGEKQEHLFIAYEIKAGKLGTSYYDLYKPIKNRSMKYMSETARTSPSKNSSTGPALSLPTSELTSTPTSSLLLLPTLSSFQAASPPSMKGSTWSHSGLRREGLGE